jgi:hypothetical protein
MAKRPGKAPKNPAAVALGRLGGKVGGLSKVPKGFSALTAEERRAVAKAAAAKRWAGVEKKARGKKQEGKG